uniref:DUF5723 domain-containing protein n=1 Tax=candidate division WOR-3 bacterium TaxID=2052148 RepID=A0A7C3J5H5_UNCW3
MKKFILLFISIYFSILIFPAFYSGDLGLYFLNIPVDPLSQAYSTTSSAVKGRSGDLINPASLYSTKNENTFSFTYMPFLVSSHFGLFTYNFKSSQILLKYFNSGVMERRDSLNNDLGEFFSSDLLLEYSTSFKIKKNLYVGGGLNLGLEKVLEYNSLFSSLNLGLIYEKVYFDFLNLGFQILNVGGVYNFEKSSLTPAKFVLGFSIDKEDMPFSVNLDVGKILDRKYFYSFALKFSLIRPNYQKNVVKEEKVGILDTSRVDTLLIVKKDSFELEKISDTILTVTTDSFADTLKSEDKTDKEYKSYAEFLDEKNDSIENVVKEEKTENYVKKSEDKLPEVKKNIFSPLSLDIILGVSSDRTDLQLGYPTDLTSALTAGFKLSYNNVSVLWSSKFWGELGVSQSIGLKMSF